MDVRTAVAASMLPASRAVVAAAFRELRHDDAAHGSASGFLELLWSACRAGEPLVASVVSELLAAADQALETGDRKEIVAVPVFDERYPPLLACINDPPPVLWVKGDFQTLARPAVAVIGSRAASPYALQVGTRIAAELAERGIVVVSGLARGVDSAAHRGCLEGRGSTAAVLGCGLDRVYPPEHDELASEIAGRGVLLAELAPGAAPLPAHFPLRNRIISGLSLATVVVEASEHSGSLITARCALEQGRDVMAVPGSVLTGRNRGSHALLKDGARIVETADDILGELGWPAAAAALEGPRKSLISGPLVARMLPGECYDLDALVELTGLDGPAILARLTELELAGIVAVSQGRYVRRS
jgi:DNA processing protein